MTDRFRKNSFCIGMVLLSMFATGLVLLATWNYGAGISTDSVGYIAAARTSFADSGMLYFNGTPFVFQPPFYPFLLGLVAAVPGKDPAAAAGLLNAVLFGLSILLSGFVARKWLGFSPWLALAGSALMIIAGPFFTVALMVWSELLFIFLVLCALALGYRYIQGGNTLVLVLFAVVTALSILTRLIGVVLLAAGGVYILKATKFRLGKASLHLMLFLIICSLPITGWGRRNYVLTGEHFGERAPSAFNFLDNLQVFFGTLREWCMPSGMFAPWVVLPLACGSAGVYLGTLTTEDWIRMKTAWTKSWPLVVYVGLYTVFLLVSATKYAMDTIDSRLLSPIFAPAVLCLICFASCFRFQGRPAARRVLGAILVVCLLGMWGAASISECAAKIKGGFTQGIRVYSDRTWRESDIVHYISTYPFEKGAHIYTNAPDALYLFTNRYGKWCPAKGTKNSTGIKNKLEALKGHWPQETPAYLVWFSSIQREYVFTPDELKEIAQLDEITRLNKGTIYKVRQ